MNKVKRGDVNLVIPNAHTPVQMYLRTHESLNMCTHMHTYHTSTYTLKNKTNSEAQYVSLMYSGASYNFKSKSKLDISLQPLIPCP